MADDDEGHSLTFAAGYIFGLVLTLASIRHRAGLPWRL
jgi:hypothetical protein